MKVVREDFIRADDSGFTRGQLRAGEKQGRWRRVDRLVYRIGSHDPTPIERALAAAVATDAVVSGRLAAVLHDLDAGAVPVADLTVHPGQANERRVRRRVLPSARLTMVDGFLSTDGLQTLVDLAAVLDDDSWEQALESALRKGLLTVDELEQALPVLGASRVLRLRPPGAPPTESLLETRAVQLIGTIPGLGEPIRQLNVCDEHDRFVARVDLGWPDLGLFLELDGEHHRAQPVYDASRETAVVAATGWLCARLTWTEVVHHPTATARRLAAIVEQARRRPLQLV
jgi:hypothetical protein